MDIFESSSDVSLWALDEIGVWLESSNYYSLSPKGKPTVIERNGSNKGVNIIGATEVIKHFDLFYQTHSKDDGNINSAHVIRFSEDLLAYDQSRGILITIVQWDNARIHTAEEVKQFAKLHVDKLVILHQPSYSPELNPQEEMWHWLNDFISKATALKNEQELLTLIQEFKNYITQRPDLVRKRMYARHWFK